MDTDSRGTTTAARAPGRGRPNGERGRRARILDFWRSVELFSPPELRKTDPQDGRHAVRAGQPAPWSHDHWWSGRRCRQDYTWSYTVYGGVFSLDRFYQELERVFPPSTTEVDERTPRGDSALFAVRVTDDGRMLLDSLMVTSASWAISRAVHPGPSDPGWLDGFEPAAQQLLDRMREAVAAAEHDDVATGLREAGVEVSRPVTADDIEALARLAAEHFGIGTVLSPSGAQVHADEVRRAWANEARVDLLNSFFLEDLRRVADAAADGDTGDALDAFLGDDATVGRLPRLDVRDEAARAELLRMLAPDRVPVGRWPSDTAHSLATSQQLAIDTIVERLADRGGVLGVNGPPGTGKTTMLRDLVAALVTERAERLAGLPSPADAFTDELLGWRTEKWQHTIRPLRADLTGFEMVVASSNNTAVDNVTKEIPQLRAIDESWRATATYFPVAATRVLGEPAWGLVAAVLGNKANRAGFVERLWWNPKPGNEAEPGMSYRLGAVDAGAARTAWGEAVAAFRSAREDEQRLRAQRQDAHELLQRLDALRLRVAAERSAIDDAMARLDRADRDAARASGIEAAAARAEEFARERRREHRAVRPGLWEILFTGGRAIRRWHAEDEPLATEVTATTAEARATAERSTRARLEAERAHDALATATERGNAAQRELRRAERALSLAAALCGEHVPDDAWQADDRRRETAAPWLDAAWNEARTRVFIAALDVHAAFVDATAGIMRANLGAAMDVVSGRAPRDAPEPALRAAWQSLFLLVPVVSTTFASAHRLFGDLGREALGWLLVDEAGQAAPQAVVGAMWRCRRVVAVGDPLQLEPVVAVLNTTQDRLRRHHGVADTWLPSRTSVQSLADRITPVGTWLPGRERDAVWVGAPLRVHRRCDDPMFTVVNDTVYDGLMIHAVAPRPDLGLPASAWIDVASMTAQGNWVPDETFMARTVLDDLVTAGLRPADILVISPFRDTAARLRSELAPRHRGLVAGTVNTAQGKEAPVVLFVLGGNPAAPGVRHWASRQPNLLNVAVSRARQRIFVIGAHGRWAGLPYFGALARALPVLPTWPGIDAS